MCSVECTFQLNVLGIKPLLGKVHDFGVHSALLLGRRGDIVLRLVALKGFEHLGELVDSLRVLGQTGVDGC